MDRATRLRMIAQLDQARAELRDYWAEIEQSARGTEIFSRMHRKVTDIMYDETRAAESRLMALLAEYGLHEWLLKMRKDAANGNEPPTDNQPPATGG